MKRSFLFGCALGLAVAAAVAFVPSINDFDSTYFKMGTNTPGISLSGNLTNWAKLTTNAAPGSPTFASVTNALGLNGKSTEVLLANGVCGIPSFWSVTNSLAAPGDTSKVLLGNGLWGASPLTFNGVTNALGLSGSSLEVMLGNGVCGIPSFWSVTNSFALTGDTTTYINSKGLQSKPGNWTASGTTNATLPGQATVRNFTSTDGSHTTAYLDSDLQRVRFFGTDTSAASEFFEVVPTIDFAQDSNKYGAFVRMFMDNPADEPVWGAGAEVGEVWVVAGNDKHYSNRLSGNYGYVHHEGEGVLDWTMGDYSVIGTYSTGWILNAYSFYGQINCSTGGVGNAVGFYMRPFTAADTGPGHVTNYYGLYLPNQTTPTSDNYPIYQIGTNGMNRLDGTVLLGNGSGARPPLAFVDDYNEGLRRSDSGHLTYVKNGANCVTLCSNGFIYVQNTGGLLWMGQGDSFGGSTDVMLYHGGTGLITDSGKFKAEGGYQSADGTDGMSVTNTFYSTGISGTGVVTNVVVIKNGLTTSWTQTGP